MLSIIRGPLDYYVSFYHYGWWATHPEDSFTDVEAVKRAYPHFPDLSFEEFVTLIDAHARDFSDLGDRPLDGRPGYYTTQILLSYFRDPKAAYARLDERYLEAGDWARDMFDVHFLRTANLNEDLARFLKKRGASKAFLSALRARAPVLPGMERERRPDRNLEDYYTPDLREFILLKERLSLAILREADALVRQRD